VFNTPEGSNIYPERIEKLLETIHEVSQAFLFGDGQPYLTALIAIDVKYVPGASTEGHIVAEFACESLHPDMARRIICVNADLERVERIVKFVLWSGPLDPEVYGSVGAGKVRRNRKAAMALYWPMIAQSTVASVQDYASKMEYSWFTAAGKSIEQLIASHVLPNRRLAAGRPTEYGRRTGDWPMAIEPTA